MRWSPECAGGQTPAASCPESVRRSRFRLATKSVLERWRRRCWDSESAARQRRRARKTETLRGETGHKRLAGKMPEHFRRSLSCSFPVPLAGPPAPPLIVLSVGFDRPNRPRSIFGVGMPGPRVHRGVSGGVETGSAGAPREAVGVNRRRSCRSSIRWRSRSSCWR